jgi:hypothetical protein
MTTIFTNVGNEKYAGFKQVVEIGWRLVTDKFSPFALSFLHIVYDTLLQLKVFLWLPSCSA